MKATEILIKHKESGIVNKGTTDLAGPIKFLVGLSRHSGLNWVSQHYIYCFQSFPLEQGKL